MKNIETVEGILTELDLSISKRDKGYQIIESEYGKPEGYVLSSDYPVYKSRKDDVTDRFNREAMVHQTNLDKLCMKIRKKQPVLSELTEDSLNFSNYIPRQIALGKMHVQYENLDFYVPKMVTFPIEKSMYICDEKQINLIHKLFLRLMFALPVGKIEFYVFDPNGLGKAVGVFNSLFSVESIFPTKKIISTSVQLKKELNKALAYAEHLIQEVFSVNCSSWEEYNRVMYSKRHYNSILPYKVFTFVDVPDGMDTESFDMFRKLLIHSKECGFLVIFSFNEIVLEAEDSKLNTITLELKKCIEKSQQLHEIVNYTDKRFNTNNLKISYIGEKLPAGIEFQHLIDIYKRKLDEQKNCRFSFEEIIDSQNLFDKMSIDGLTVPVGFNETTSDPVNLIIGDETPHFLIGGTTGSGKSNLLHNLIVSACSRYSPQELQIYLLDFKEGVEFSIYANPVLPHARLVATEADTEYGISVLTHLVKEKEKRYSLFKKNGCKDIKTYRQSCPDNLMPRVLVVIDEFQVLFSNADKAKTLDTLEILVKQGRACGIHLVMATQSLKGIDFGTLGSQFGGRIALKCSAEDSKQLLGSITSNNEEATELRIPYAILNTSQGNVLGNIKFAIPYAESLEIKKNISMMGSNPNGGRIDEIKIFDGQRMPSFPQLREFESHGSVSIKLGEFMDFGGKQFSIPLSEKEGNNILICGNDDQIKWGLIKSMVLSALYNDNLEDLVYVGNGEMATRLTRLSNKVICIENMKAFLEKYSDDIYKTRKLVLFDNCNLIKEVAYPSGYATNLPEKAKCILEFFEDSYTHGSYSVALYNRGSNLKNSKLPMDSFGYRIGFMLSADDKNYIQGNATMLSAPMKNNRAFFAENGTIINWFRPYVENSNEQ